MPETPITERLRATRANMLGTEDEQHYYDCHEAADEIERLQRELTRLNIQIVRHLTAAQNEIDEQILMNKMGAARELALQNKLDEALQKLKGKDL